MSDQIMLLIFKSLVFYIIKNFQYCNISSNSCLKKKKINNLKKKQIQQYKDYLKKIKSFIHNMLFYKQKKEKPRKKNKKKAKKTSSTAQNLIG